MYVKYEKTKLVTDDLMGELHTLAPGSRYLEPLLGWWGWVEEWVEGWRVERGWVSKHTGNNRLIGQLSCAEQVILIVNESVNSWYIIYVTTC